MVEKKLRIGMVPTKRNFLSMEEACRQKEMVYTRLAEICPQGVELVNIDNVIDRGILWRNQDVPAVVRYLKDGSVDSLFMLHCDFGTEEVVGALAGEMKLPVLLWGPRDDAPEDDGNRKRDTQCGIFASSKVLQRYGIPFSYITNSWINGEEFSEGFLKFVRVTSVVRTLKNLRIAQVGTRPEPFMSVICNEGELLEKFGIRVVPISVADIVDKSLALADGNSREITDTLGDIKARVDCSGMEPVIMKRIAALKLVLAQVAAEKGCASIALECWSLFPKVLGVVPCFAASELTDIGLPVACETDIHGAVTSALLQAVALSESPTFFADLTIRHPENENAELLWHCGPFPYSIKAPESSASIIAGRSQWKLKNGDVTIARFDGVRGIYSLFGGEGRSIEGPYTTGTYAWVEVDDWPKWERKFIYGPYIHHVVGIHGRYADCLAEACRFIPDLNSDTV